jgi:hypothetical protein
MKTRRGTWRLDQKDVIELVELEMFLKLENRLIIKTSFRNADKHNIRVLDAVS